MVSKNCCYVSLHGRRYPHFCGSTIALSWYYSCHLKILAEITWKPGACNTLNLKLWWCLKNDTCKKSQQKRETVMNYFKEENRLFDVLEVILEVLANDHGVLIFEKDDIGQNPMSIFVPPHLESGCETNEFADARGPLPWWVTLVEMMSNESTDAN